MRLLPLPDQNSRRPPTCAGGGSFAGKESVKAGLPAPLALSHRPTLIRVSQQHFWLTGTETADLLLVFPPPCGLQHPSHQLGL